MRLNQVLIRRWLPSVGLVLAALVIVGGTFQWPLAVVYGLTALMFAAVFAGRSAERRNRPDR